eukprot:8776352-Alexandrium_andersonii.AAC.1
MWFYIKDRMSEEDLEKNYHKRKAELIQEWKDLPEDERALVDTKHARIVQTRRILSGEEEDGTAGQQPSTPWGFGDPLTWPMDTSQISDFRNLFGSENSFGNFVKLGAAEQDAADASTLNGI